MNIVILDALRGESMTKDSADHKLVSSHVHLINVDVAK